MPFIRVNEFQTETVHDVNVANIISFSVKKGSKFTTMELVDNITINIVDDPRQLRGYIKKAEGTLPEKAEPNEEVGGIPFPASR